MQLRAFFICLLILVIRGWDRLVRPGLWAEDGTAFFADALTKGWASVFIPYEGYYHTFNRVLMLICTDIFPILMIPAVITGCCYILYAAIMSIFANATYRYLVKSDWNRIFISAGCCVVPGGIEVIGNLCNSHRLLAVIILFFGLRSLKERFKFSHFLVAFLVAGSAAEVLVFVPLFLFRSYLRVSAKEKFSAVVKEIIFVLIILVWAVAAFRVRGTSTEPISIDIAKIIPATFAAFTFGYVLEPILGWRLTENIFGHARFIFWMLAAFFSALLFRDLWRNRASNRKLMYLGLACFFGILEISWIARPGSLVTFKDFLPGMWWGNTRILFSLTFGGYFLWSIIFANVSKKMGFAYIFIYFILTGPLKVEAYGDVSSWKSTALKLESSIKTGCPNQVHVEFFPVGWSFDYHSPPSIRPANCPE